MSIKLRLFTVKHSIFENIQRVDLNPMEEAEGYAVLQGKYGFTQAKIASSVSKSRPEIANKLRLLIVIHSISGNNSLTYGFICLGHKIKYFLSG